jgi:hypothetical protein
MTHIASTGTVRRKRSSDYFKREPSPPVAPVTSGRVGAEYDPLTPGECLPHDRRFAIALDSTPF